MGCLPGEVSEESVTQEKQKKGWRNVESGTAMFNVQHVNLTAIIMIKYSTSRDKALFIDVHAQKVSTIFYGL